MTIKTHPHLIVVGVMLLAVIALSLAVRGAVAQTGGWQTYTSDDAAYSFDYPPDTVISTSDDASQAYKIIYAEFALTDTTDYQGISVMVLDNPKNLQPQQFVSAGYTAAGVRQGVLAQRSVAMLVDQRPAVRLQRDPVIGDQDKYSVLIPGEGVMYRLDLYGGGLGGAIEPPKTVLALFDHVVKSFRVLAQPLKPKQTLLTPSAVSAEPAATDIFTYPLRSGAGVNYGVPVGIVNDDTHMEWLGYGIRNLDQWGVKCYGVDWTRMLHTGEDWYRLDGANTAGTPVYAVADGVVVRQRPRHQLSRQRDSDPPPAVRWARRIFDVRAREQRQRGGGADSATRAADRHGAVSELHRAHAQPAPQVGFAPAFRNALFPGWHGHLHARHECLRL